MSVVGRIAGLTTPSEVVNKLRTVVTSVLRVGVPAPLPGAGALVHGRSPATARRLSLALRGHYAIRGREQAPDSRDIEQRAAGATPIFTRRATSLRPAIRPTTDMAVDETFGVWTTTAAKGNLVHFNADSRDIEQRAAGATPIFTRRATSLAQPPRRARLSHLGWRSETCDPSYDRHGG
jgi:hypothetical protein